MTLKIQEGRTYVTRGEGITGPIVKNTEGSQDWTKEFPWMDISAPHNCWRSDGRFLTNPSDMDLVAEWSEPAPQEDGPVRYRQVPEIIPGVYDLFTIHKGPNIPFLKFTGNDFINLSRELDRVEQLEAAAVLFASLAKALRSQP